MFREDISKCIPCTKHYFCLAHFAVGSYVLLEVSQPTAYLSACWVKTSTLGVCRVQCTPSGLVLYCSESVAIAV